MKKKLLAFAHSLFLGFLAAPGYSQELSLPTHLRPDLDGHGGEALGTKMTRHQDYLLVSAPGYKQSGAAMLFKKENDTLLLQAVLTPSTTTTQNSFGYSLALTDSFAFVGDYAYNNYAGRIYVYKMPPKGWADMTETSVIEVPGGQPNSYFANDLSVRGHTLLTGAHLRKKAYIFELQDNDWQKVAELSSEGGAGFLGSKVLLSDSFALVMNL
ncbi:MAG: hypothetical protein HC842_09210, partial [Cytophagales bacterium]|nr:hypothetical protein [Cytophagales bacterium]